VLVCLLLSNSCFTWICYNFSDTIR
jgi:hypothetical protein